MWVYEMSMRNDLHEHFDNYEHGYGYCGIQLFSQKFEAITTNDKVDAAAPTSCVVYFLEN